MYKLILTTEQVKQIKELFQFTNLMCDVDLDYHLTGEEVDSAQCIERILSDNDCFNVDIIYYHRAMDFLIRHDGSLKDSLRIAEDFGFDLSDLNSETLASLLASQMIHEEFYEHYKELENLIEEFKEQIIEEGV
jgi:hypothetical protein